MTMLERVQAHRRLVRETEARETRARIRYFFAFVGASLFLGVDLAGAVFLGLVYFGALR